MSKTNQAVAEILGYVVSSHINNTTTMASGHISGRAQNVNAYISHYGDILMVITEYIQKGMEWASQMGNW